MYDVYQNACMMISEGMRSIQDNTRKGKCVKCGECCSNLLPLSLAEIERLRAYIAEHQISMQQGHEPDCPFLNAEKRCMVYEVRPLICRIYKCNIRGISYRDFLLMLKEDRRTVNVRQAIDRRDSK